MFRSATGSTLHLLLESQLVGRCAPEDLVGVPGWRPITREEIA